MAIFAVRRWRVAWQGPAHRCTQHHKFCFLSTYLYLYREPYLALAALEQVGWRGIGAGKPKVEPPFEQRSVDFDGVFDGVDVDERGAEAAAGSAENHLRSQVMLTCALQVMMHANNGGQ